MHNNTSGLAAAVGCLLLGRYKYHDLKSWTSVPGKVFQIVYGSKEQSRDLKVSALHCASQPARAFAPLPPSR